MAEILETEALPKIIWAKRLKFYGAVLFSLALLLMLFGKMETSSDATLFAILGGPALVMLVSLCFIRCSNCGASLYFRKGYFMMTWGMKWVPIWMLPLPQHCEICGLKRE